MDVTGQRIETALAGGGTVASVAFFWWVYGGLATAPPGASIRAMAPLPLLALLVGHVWWLVCLVTGARQLFTRPRWYGLVTIGFGAVQFLAVPVAARWLMNVRGIEWGS